MKRSMRRAFIILALLLLLLAPSALAEEKAIHDEWHPYQDFFTIGGDYYEVINDHSLQDGYVRLQTLLKRNQASFIITGKATEPDDDAVYTLDKELCTADGAYRFCITDISFDPKNEARSDESGRYRYGTRIKIYEVKPETALLEVTRALSKDSLHYGEDEKVTVTITNKGLEKATDITYDEASGPGLLFTDQRDYDRRLPRHLTKTIPELYPGKSLSFQYHVQATGYVNTSTLTSNLTYSDPDPATTVKTDKVSITWPYKRSLKVAPEKANINDHVTITYDLTNQEDKPLETNLTLLLDHGVSVDDPGVFSRSGNRLAYHGALEPEEHKTFQVTVHSRYTGEYNITAELGLGVNGEKFTVKDQDSYAVKTDTVTPSIVVSKTKTRSGEPLTIGFYLKNEDEAKPFINIRGWAGSDFFNQTFSEESLAPGDEKNIIFRPYELPKTENETVDHLIAISGTFQTQNGEVQSFYTEKTITVIPKNMSILLTKTVEPASLKRGEEATITVSVENLADSASNYVQASEDYDEKLEKSFGSDQAETFLYPGEDRQLYVYRLRVPYDYTKKNFTVTTILTAKGQAITKSTKTITVTDPLEPQEVPATQEPAPQDNTTAEQQEPTTTPDEKPPATSDNNDGPQQEPQEPRQGLLSRFVNGIADFFAGFFS